jgi:hypothetical protein
MEFPVHHCITEVTMKDETFKHKLISVFQSEKVLDLGALKNFIGTTSRMTVFRKLKEVGYYSSYSHFGKFYTLQSIPHFNRNGLWSYGVVHFSQWGTLIETLAEIVRGSEAGYFASELEELLSVFVHNALGKLSVSGRLLREQLGSQYLYLSPIATQRQLTERKRWLTQGAATTIENGDSSKTEFGEQIQTFLSVLNEKQRRLYLGLESLKYGHGGDRRLSWTTGVNVKTIARGRVELLSGEIVHDRVRRRGAGRPPLKKTKSSRSLKS